MKGYNSFGYNIGPKNVLDSTSMNKKGVCGWFMISVSSASKNMIDMGSIEIGVNDSEVCRVPNDRKLKILLKAFKSNGNLSHTIIGSQNRVISAGEQVGKELRNKLRIICVV